MSQDASKPDPDPAAGPMTDLLISLSSTDDMARVSAAAAELGVRVHREMPFAAMIDVQGPRSAIAALEQVPGVASVREQHGFQLPPFDERIPQ